MQASSRGFYNGGGQQSYYPTADDRYQAAESSQPQDYNQESFEDLPEDRGYPSYRSPEQQYEDTAPESSGRGFYDRMGTRGWDSRAYLSSQQQGGWGEQQNASPARGQQVLDTYSLGENAFLPVDGDPIPEAEEANNSWVLDDVESYYNRPESIVEDVQKYYNARGQRVEPPVEVRLRFCCC